MRRILGVADTTREGRTPAGFPVGLNREGLMTAQVVSLCARIAARHERRVRAERRVMMALHTAALRLAASYPDARQVPDTLRDAVRCVDSKKARPLAPKLAREVARALDAGADVREVATVIRALADDIECVQHGRAA